MNFNPLLPMAESWLLLALIAGLVLWPAWRSAARLPWRWRMVSMILRIAGLTALALVALNPGRWVDESRLKVREWAVLIDRSQSMQTPDVAGATRWQAAVRTARRIERAAERPERIQWYTFASELEPVSGYAALSALQPDGERTRLEEAILDLLARHRAGDRSLTGILVIGDGRRVEPEMGSDVGLAARSQGTPIYVMSLGGPVVQPDLALSIARRQVIAFPGQPVRVTARVHNQGLGPIRIPVALESIDGTQRLDERHMELPDNAGQSVTFEFAAPDAGYTDYAIVAPLLDGETREHNNRATFGVSVLPGRMRVLLVEGAPYWDSKFLAQRLRQQVNIELTAVYRLASDRFFVLREHTEEHQADLESVFPVDADALTRYDLIMFGKGLDAVLTVDRIAALTRYVRDYGGRIVYFRGKPYLDRFEALETLEPLIWSGMPGGAAGFQPLRTRQAMALFGDILPDADDPVWMRLPALRNVQPARPRGFTDVAAVGVSQDHPTAGRRHAEDLTSGAYPPLLAWRIYGRGLLTVINAEGFWRWDFFPDSDAVHDMYQEFWLQLLQWSILRADFMPGRDMAVNLSAAAVLPDKPVRVTVRRRSGAGAMAGNPEIMVFQGDRIVDRRQPTRLSGDDERWETLLALSHPGLYRIEASALDDSGNRGTADTVLRVKAPPSELDEVSSDPDRLARLAASSGGRPVDRDAVSGLLGELEIESPADREGNAVWQSDWDRLPVLLVVVACFTAEFFVRRRHGLM